MEWDQEKYSQKRDLSKTAQQRAERRKVLFFEELRQIKVRMFALNNLPSMVDEFRIWILWNEF